MKAVIAVLLLLVAVAAAQYYNYGYETKHYVPGGYQYQWQAKAAVPVVAPAVYPAVYKYY